MNWKSMEMLQFCCILQIATLDWTKRLVNYTPAKNTLSHSAKFFTEKKDATGNYESSQSIEKMWSNFTNPGFS